MDTKSQSKRIYIYWAIALTLLTAAGLFCWLVVVPVMRVRSVLQQTISEDKGKSVIYTSVRIRKALKRLGGPQVAGGKLALYLHMPSALASNRTLAIAALAETRTDSAASTLVVLLRDRDAEVRRAAARGLTGFKEKAEMVAEALCRALNDKDKHVRQAAAFALINMGSRAGRFVPELEQALANPDPRVREYAALALASTGPWARQAAASLEQALGDPDESVRWAAAATLLNLGEEREAGRTLRALLNSSQPKVRLVAAYAIVTMQNNHEDALAVIIGGLDPEETTEVRRRALDWTRALGSVASSAVPKLMKLLDDPDSYTRVGAVRALEVMGTAASGCSHALEKLSNDDPDPVVRQAAAEALKRIKALQEEQKR